MSLPAQKFFESLTPTQMRLAREKRERAVRNDEAAKRVWATRRDYIARQFQRQFEQAWELIEDGEPPPSEPVNSILPNAPITMRAISVAVCKHCGISKHDLVSIRRTAPLVRARWIAIYLARTLTPMSFPEMGRRLGGRDHTSTLHGYRQMVKLLETDAQLRADIAFLTSQLKPDSEAGV